MLAGSREALNAGSYYQVAWVPEDNDEAGQAPVSQNGVNGPDGPAGSMCTDDQGSVARSRGWHVLA